MSTTVCSVDECERAHAAKGLCLPHYKRWRRWGDPRGHRPVTTDAERFWPKVDTSGDCWTWRAGVFKSTGYGAFHFSGRGLITAHRAAWLLAHGDVQEGLVIDHLCRNRICVRPDHLKAVTNTENLERGAGYALRNGMRDHCIHGHAYTPENTYISPAGDTRCRTCARERDRQRTRRKKASA